MCGNNVMYCNEKLKKINKDVNTLSLEEFNKKYMQEWSKVDNLLMNEVAADKNTNNIKNTEKNIIVNNGEKTTNSSKKNNVKDCDDKCQTDFTNSLNSIGIENSQEKYSYYSPYRPEMEEANYEFRGVLANVGLVLMGSGVPVGGILVVPKALDYLGGSIYSFQDGDIEGGIKNLAGLATLGIFTGSLYQNYGTSLTQAKDQSNGKVFHGNGQYYLDNRTSVVGVSGDNVGRINFVNGVPNNYYGVVDGKFVMGNITSGSGLVSTGGTTTVLEMTSSASTNVGLLVNTSPPKGILDLYGLNLQMFAEKDNGNKIYTGELVKVNKPDKGADALAERIGGESRVKFSDDPKGREFDSVSDKYIAQAKPDLNGYGKSWRNQTKATFEAAKETGKVAYFQFEGIPNESIIRKIKEYGDRYGVKYIIDTEPLGTK